MVGALGRERREAARAPPTTLAPTIGPTCRWGKKENPYPYLGENRANPLPPIYICHNILLFLLQAMGLVRAISLRLRKGTTVFPRQGNRQIHGL